MALYQAGNYAEAAKRFAQSNDAYAHYNRGNALAKAGELEAALDAYDQALEAQPDLHPALKNKALVEALIQEQAQAQAEQKPESPAENPDDEPDQPGQTAQPGADGQTGTGGEASPQGQGEAGSGDPQASAKPPSGGNEVPGSELGDEQTTTPPLRRTDASLDEQRQALEQWLRQIPDNPGELLRRKFWYEQQQHQDKTR